MFAAIIRHIGSKTKIKIIIINPKTQCAPFKYSQMKAPMQMG